MFFSQIMAKAANARIPASTRALLASHADCVLVVDTNFYRAAFRITTDGRLIAVSSLADGDVHIGLDDKGFQARGNAALLRDLGEVWKELRGSLEEWLSIVFGRSMGMQAADISDWRRMMLNAAGTILLPQRKVRLTVLIAKRATYKEK